MPKGYSREEEQKWNLLGSGQDSYSGQNSQDPRTSRLIQSWIVQDDGQLHRELPEPYYVPPYINDTAAVTGTSPVTITPSFANEWFLFLTSNETNFPTPSGWSEVNLNSWLVSTQVSGTAPVTVTPSGSTPLASILAGFSPATSTATVSIVQSRPVDFSSATQTVTFTTVAANDAIIIAIPNQDHSISQYGPITVQDSAGNSYRSFSQFSADGAGNYAEAWMFVAPGIAGGAVTITLTLSGWYSTFAPNGEVLVAHGLSYPGSPVNGGSIGGPVGPVVGLYEFDQNNGQGAVNRYYFCAARVNSTVGTKNCQFFQNVAGAWQAVSTVGTLADAPQCVTQENNFFLADGVSNWLFDGTVWVPQGIQIPLNVPAITVATNGNPQVLISNQLATIGGQTLSTGGVGVYFWPDSAQAANNSNGALSMTYPAPAFATSTVNYIDPSLIFNGTQLNQGLDPNINPMEWQRYQGATTTAGDYYTLPYPTTATSYQMAVLAQLVIPKAGAYTVTFVHDDGAFFGFGPGLLSGAAPSSSGAPQNIPWQTGAGGGTVMANYPILFGNNNAGFTSETTAIDFPSADTYPLEMDFRQYENNQMLGLAIIIASVPPGTAPQANIYIANSASGLGIDAVIGRYYWYDNADQTVGVATESSSSPIGLSSGPLIAGTVEVFQQPGTFNAATTSTAVVGHNSTDNPGPVAPDLDGTMVGKYVYLNGSLAGTIASVGHGSTLAMTKVSSPAQVTLANGTVVYEATYLFSFTGQTTPGAPLTSTPTSLMSPGANNALAGTIWDINGFTNSGNNIQSAIALSSTDTSIVFNNASAVAETHAATATSPGTTLYLAANSLVTVNTARAVICDPRCTHWNIYASESDGSQIGEYLTSVPVTSTSFLDSSPFIDSAATQFLPIFRPVRNDPPVGSKILTVHKVRQFRAETSSPNFFAFTANEEVTAGNNGDPAQCLPGSDSDTVSDMVNVVSFPDQSARLRSLVSHMDALYMFSEKQCYPLYGQSVDDFAISQMVTFALGGAGRFAGLSTPNGLVFMSYDKRAFLYPTSLYSTYLAQGGAAQSALTEIGKPMRNVFAQIPSTRLDEVVSVHYHFGIRDWWVLSFPTSATSDVPQTWVWDFMGKGWFQLQRGFASLQVFEVSEGALVLIGGGVDGNSYVIDDQTGTYYTVNNQTYAVAPSLGNLPVATWRPALIDFGNSEIAHIFRRLELEFSSEVLAQDISILVYFDPVNVDSPGVGKALHLRPALGACRYSAMVADQGSGAVCKRMLLQVQVRASTNTGVIRGIVLYADPAPGFITGANRPGGV